MDLNIKDYKSLSIFTVLFLILLGYFFISSSSIHPHLILRIALTGIMFITGIYIMNNTSKDLYKIAFIILLIFGLITVIFNPIMLVPDEAEHYARADLTSTGVLIPNYVEGHGYKIGENIFQLSFSRNLTFLDDTPAFDSISHNLTDYHSCFSQNPFYGYLLSGLGILLTKILDLSVIWSLWLGRLFNFLFYLIICVYSIYRSPKYKMGLFVISALPVALSQGASFSIDFLIISLMILASSSLVRMYNSKVDIKELTLFFILILLVGLIKVPYVLFVFLILIIPRDKFKNNTVYSLSLILPFIILIICSIWGIFYTSGQLFYSYRGDYFLTSNINTSAQLNFLISNPIGALKVLSNIILTIPQDCIGFFKFYHGIWLDCILPVSIIYTIFFIFFSFIYPIDIKLNKRTRLIVFIIVSLIFLGLNMVQYLSWTPVGLFNVEGMQSRYYIPLLLFLPLIFNLNFSKDKFSDKINLKNISITIIILALVSFIFMFLFTYY